MCRKRGRRGTSRRWRRRLRQLSQSGLRHTRAAVIRGVRVVRGVRGRWGAHSPVVLLVGSHPAPRRLRRTVRHAARVYARALGVALPPGTTIVVAPAVHAHGPEPRLASLLEIYAPVTGPRRTVIHLAVHADDEGPLAEAELLAVLRTQIGRLLEPTIGSPTQTLPISLPPAGGRTAAPIVPL